jgi:acetyl-CoA carboxylase carboxyl transferase subunit alpha
MTERSALQFLDFEKPVLDIVTRIEDLQTAVANGTPTAEKKPKSEIARLEIKCARVARLLYRHLSAVQKVQVARHPQRPQGTDYLSSLFSNYVPLAGDRRYGDDTSLEGGLATFTPTGQSCAVLAISKGKTTAERIARNFGMAGPEGYRKAQRIMQLAARMNLPVITLVDTPGAYPGIDAEERGQAQAIAESLEVLMRLHVPVVSLITGEGGSGGALALAAADRVLMLEHSIYSVISPEGCAAILWKEASKDTIPLAAEALKLTAQNLKKLGVIDSIIKEPVGGAQRDYALTMARAGKAIAAALTSAQSQASNQAATRRSRFLAMGR